MEFFKEEEFENYIRDKYSVFHSKTDEIPTTEISGRCDSCKKEAFFKVENWGHSNFLPDETFPRLITHCITCPGCQGKCLILSVLIVKVEQHGFSQRNVYEYFELERIPANKSLNEIFDIPNEYSVLQETVLEANKCLELRMFISATVMYRRALEFIVKNILKAQGKTLFNQLEWLKENSNALDLDLSDLFHDCGELIRKVGNQGAHIVEDEDLQKMKDDDAKTIHDLCLFLVSEVFVKPRKMIEIKERLIQNRKLK